VSAIPFAISSLVMVQQQKQQSYKANGGYADLATSLAFSKAQILHRWLKR
jgi:hypothetical protein